MTTTREGGCRSAVLCGCFSPTEFAEDRLQHREHHARPLGADHEVPHRLELLPAGGVGRVAQTGEDAVVRRGTAGDRSPSIEVAIRPLIAALERRLADISAGRNTVWRVSYRSQFSVVIRSCATMRLCSAVPGYGVRM